MSRYRSMSNQRHLHAKQFGLCNGCREPLKLRHLAVDHIIPRKKGGTHELNNLQLLCTSCNSVKGKRSQSYLMRRLQRRNWRNRRPADTKIHAMVWTGSRWVDVFDLVGYLNEPESCFSISVKGKKRSYFADIKDFYQAWMNMREGLYEMIDAMDSAHASMCSK